MKSEAQESLENLSSKHRKFVEEYVVSLSVAKAYRAAYVDSTHSAALRSGHRLLKNAEIKKAIKFNLTNTFDNLEITREKILREYAAIAFSDIRNVVEWSKDNVGLIGSNDIPDHVAGSISEVTIKTEKVSDRDDIEVTTDTFKVKMHNKVAALDKLSEYTKLMESGEDDCEVDFI